MSKLLTYILVLLFICSCSNGATEQSLNTIHISGFENKSYDFASLASKVDTLFLYMKKNATEISAVKDICLNGSQIYVVDESGLISMFDVHSGELLSQIKKVGHSSQEYVNVSSIKCVDDTLFVLDGNSRKIIKYNKNFSYLGKINLDFIPLDFEITKDGFLFSRLDVSSGENRFIQTDRNGNTKNKFLTSSPFGEQIYTSKSFVNNTCLNEIYLHEPMSEDIYMWNDGKISPVYNLIFQSDNLNKKKEGNDPILKDYFITSSHFICSFIYDNKQCYCIYSKKDGSIKAGSFDVNSGLPFSPICQKGDTIIGIYHTNDLKALKNWRPKCEDSAFTLFFYKF